MMYRFEVIEENVKGQISSSTGKYGCGKNVPILLAIVSKCLSYRNNSNSVQLTMCSKLRYHDYTVRKLMAIG